MHPIDLLSGLRQTASWRMVAVALWLTVSLVLGLAAGWLTRRLLARVAARTSNQWDDAVVARMGGPLSVGWALLCGHLLLPWLELAPDATASARRAVSVALVTSLFWALLRAIDVVGHVITTSSWASHRLASRSFVSLGGKALKISVVVVSAVAILSQLGYPVGSILAGLGIGGLALALAAQKTVENVFGAFSIAVDEPFRQGDFIKVEEVMGTVEAIGLRSTRIRTLDRTLVAIPNGKLAEMRTETFAARDRLRLACTVALVRQTSADQMRAVLAGIERALRDHPKVWPDGITVRFKELGSFSLDVEVMAWFATTDWPEFQLIRQEMLLGFLEVIQRAGTALAYPTRTVHVAGDARTPTA